MLSAAQQGFRQSQAPVISPDCDVFLHDAIMKGVLSIVISDGNAKLICFEKTFPLLLCARKSTFPPGYGIFQLLHSLF